VTVGNELVQVGLEVESAESEETNDGDTDKSKDGDDGSDDGGDVRSDSLGGVRSSNGGLLHEDGHIGEVVAHAGGVGPVGSRDSTSILLPCARNIVPPHAAGVTNILGLKMSESHFHRFGQLHVAALGHGGADNFGVEELDAVG